MAFDLAKVEELKQKYARPRDMKLRIGKLGHVVVNSSDVERSIKFYTEIMGFQISDIYPDDMVPGGMAFFRSDTDHHSIAVVGSMDKNKANTNSELNHIAFEVASLDDVLRMRDHLKKHNVPVDFEGRRRAGAQIAVEFRDPDGHRLEVFWGLDQIGADGKSRPREEWIWAHSLEEAIEKPVRGQDTTLRDPSLLRKLSAEEEARLREHSLRTQAEKLGTK